MGRSVHGASAASTAEYCRGGLAGSCCRRAVPGRRRAVSCGGANAGAVAWSENGTATPNVPAPYSTHWAGEVRANADSTPAPIPVNNASASTKADLIDSRERRTFNLRNCDGPTVLAVHVAQDVDPAVRWHREVCLAQQGAVSFARLLLESPNGVPAEFPRGGATVELLDLVGDFEEKALRCERLAGPGEPLRPLARSHLRLGIGRRDPARRQQLPKPRQIRPLLAPDRPVREDDQIIEKVPVIPSAAPPNVAPSPIDSFAVHYPIGRSLPSHGCTLPLARSPSPRFSHPGDAASRAAAVRRRIPSTSWRRSSPTSCDRLTLQWARSAGGTQ